MPGIRAKVAEISPPVQLSANTNCTLWATMALCRRRAAAVSSCWVVMESIRQSWKGTDLQSQEDLRTPGGSHATDPRQCAGKTSRTAALFVDGANTLAESRDIVRAGQQLTPQRRREG